MPERRISDVASRLGLGWTRCVAVFAIVVGGIAVRAQDWARADVARFRPGGPFPHPQSAGLHVPALAVLAAGAAAPLLTARRTWPLAAAVPLGVTVGLMRICAAPASRSVLAPVTWTGERNLVAAPVAGVAAQVTRRVLASRRPAGVSAG